MRRICAGVTSGALSISVEYYFNGEGVERDMKKAKYYDELAAMGWDVRSRHNLGVWRGLQGTSIEH